MKRETDTSKYAGHFCQVCGERVTMSGDRKKGNVSGFWRTNPESGEVTAWHIGCLVSSVKP